MKESSNIDYQSFSNLIERLAIYTERLEHVTNDLKEFRNQHKSEIDELDRRVRVLENDKLNHNGKITGIGIVIGALITGLTMFFYYRMGGK